MFEISKHFPNLLASCQDNKTKVNNHSFSCDLHLYFNILIWKGGSKCSLQEQHCSHDEQKSECFHCYTHVNKLLMSGPKYITGIRHIVAAKEMAEGINELSNLFLIMTLSLVRRNE